MIRITISRDQNGRITEAVVKGHAGYAEAGYDIVCAAVSILVQNAVNSVETLCNVSLDAHSRDGFLSFRCKAYTEHRDVQLLLESMVLGLRGIAEQYGAFVQVREHTI
jgi:uncharacterized protein YsxB (DUF464 family)